MLSEMGNPEYSSGEALSKEAKFVRRGEVASLPLLSHRGSSAAADSAFREKFKSGFPSVVWGGCGTLSGASV